MDSVINALVIFMDNGDQQSVDYAIAAAREHHDLYFIEKSRLLDLPLPATPTP